MTLEEHQEQLSQVYFSSQDPAVKAGAEITNQYTELLKQNQLSKAEYLQLIADVRNTTNITMMINEMANLELLNTAINGLIDVVTLTV
jgi:hypothetical protein